MRQRLEVGAAETLFESFNGVGREVVHCALVFLEGSKIAGSSRCRIGAASHHDRSVVRFVFVQLPFLLPFLERTAASKGWPAIVLRMARKARDLVNSTEQTCVCIYI